MSRTVTTATTLDNAGPDESEAVAAADSTPASAETDTGEATPTRSLGPTTRKRLLTAVIALLVLALSAATWSALDQYRRADEFARTAAYYDNEQAALEVARKFFATVTTYDHHDIDAYTTAVANASTGSFRDRYSAAGSSIKQLLTEAQVTSTGTVVAVGISGDVDGKITVIAFIDQKYQNKDLPQPRTDSLRMSAELIKVDGRWLVSDMGPR